MDTTAITKQEQYERDFRSSIAPPLVPKITASWVWGAKEPPVAHFDTLKNDEPRQSSSSSDSRREHGGRFGKQDSQRRHRRRIRIPRRPGSGRHRVRVLGRGRGGTLRSGMARPRRDGCAIYQAGLRRRRGASEREGRERWQ